MIRVVKQKKFRKREGMSSKSGLEKEGLRRRWWAKKAAEGKDLFQEYLQSRSGNQVSCRLGAWKEGGGGILEKYGIIWVKVRLAATRMGMGKRGARACRFGCRGPVLEGKKKRR